MRRKMIDKCLSIAITNLTKHEEPYCHYTFVVQGRAIIEWGTNRRGSPLMFLGYQKHTKMHSEVDAYFKAKGIMNGSFEVLNIRLTKSGEIKNSRPCQCCFDFLKGMGCKRITFSTDIGHFARMDIT